jgi:hypothetical protein
MLNIAFRNARARLAIRTRLNNSRRRKLARHLYDKYQPYTMIMRHDFVANVEMAIDALKNPTLANGSVVECGTWKGGMSAALIEIGGKDRDYYFFDSFEGLPLAQEIDGKSALAYQAETSSPNYRNNCAATLADFQHTISLTNFPTNRIHTIKGFFEATLPAFDPHPIALLRLDGDWYESTIACLNKFWDHILPGGLILIDDYYLWDGCSRAVHDFLSSRKATERIQQRAVGLAFMVKS